MSTGKPLSAVAARRARQESQLVVTQNPGPAIHENRSPQQIPDTLDNNGQESGNSNNVRSSKKRKRRTAIAAPRQDDLSAEASGVVFTTTLTPTRLESLQRDPSGALPSGEEFNRNDDEPRSDVTDLSEPDDRPLVALREAGPRQLSKIGDIERLNTSAAECVEATLRDREQLVAVGQYDLWVRRGSIHVLGAILHASSKAYRVYAPVSHALPVISHANSPYGPQQQYAEVTLVSCHSGLRRLGRLNPKFTRIWNDDADGSSRSFKIMLHTSNDRYSRPLVPFEPAAYWQKRAVSLSSFESSAAPAVLICGPKGAGKSTFGKLLSNSYLSRRASSCGVALLDLDPGQPEYCPPGEVTLHYLKDFNLGAPFTHVFKRNKSPDSVVRSHYVGHSSPKEDIQHYMECARDLYARYKSTLRAKGCPLIINSCGWIHGSGLDILEELIRNFDLTDVVYMSTLGPPEITETLRISCERNRVVLHLLSSQEVKPTVRNAADLRLMQMMSYFHIDDTLESTLRWDPEPLYLRQPYQFNFNGPKQDFVGVMILGDKWSPDNLKELINGRVLAVVAIEDREALPPSVFQALLRTLRTNSSKDKAGNATHDEQAVANDGDVAYFAALEEKEKEKMGFSVVGMLQGRRPSALQRSSEGLPYIFYGNQTNVPLDPQKTRTIGQVLVRGIGKESIEVLTPIPGGELDALKANNTPLVLVRGGVEAPGWCYLEEYYEAMAAKRDHEAWKKFVENHGPQFDDDDDSPAEFDVEEWVARTPWVDFVDSEKTSSKGDRAWRVRRNMTTSDGRRPPI